MSYQQDKILLCVPTFNHCTDLTNLKEQIHAASRDYNLNSSATNRYPHHAVSGSSITLSDDGSQNIRMVYQHEKFPAAVNIQKQSSNTTRRPLSLIGGIVLQQWLQEPDEIKTLYQIEANAAKQVGRSVNRQWIAQNRSRL